jgi:hypothetical protein
MVGSSYRVALHTVIDSTSSHADSQVPKTNKKFRDVHELYAWLSQQNLRSGPPQKHKHAKGVRIKKHHSDEVIAFLDECEPSMSDLYADIKDAYGGYGFLSRDDFAGFIKHVFVDNIRVSSATESSESDGDDAGTAAVAARKSTTNNVHALHAVPWRQNII